MKIVFSLILLSVVQQSLFAQEGQERRGDLEDVEIEIVKERQISLPPATRNFEKIPPRPADPDRPSFNYDFRPLKFQAQQINPAIRPLKLRQEEASEVFGGYISAGYGNYASPYLEGFINSKRDRNKLVGAHGFLRNSAKGPVDGENSGSGSSGVSVYGKAFSDFISLSAEAGYEHRFTHFYGYEAPDSTVKADDIRQAFNLFSLKGELSNTRSSAFAWKLGAGFSYLADRYEARESEADFQFRSAYDISEQSAVAIDADYFLINRKDSLIEATPRSLFVVNPRYEFSPVDGLKLTAGVAAAFENDTIDSDFHIYPDVRASYPLSPSVDVTASLTGGMEKVSLQRLSKENMWLMANVPVFHTNRLLDLQAALNARVGNKISVNGGFSMATLKHLYFFRNTAEDPSRFTVDYDDVTNRMNFFASLGFAQTETFKVMLRGDLYSYSTDIDEAWHRPTYRVTGETSLNISDKFLLNVNLITQGGMKAFDPVADATVELDPAFDLNVRTEYLISERFSLFGEFNNITSTEYPLFLNYPVRGFQALGGFTWNF